MKEKILRKFRRLKIRLSFDPHPSSAPYISGDSFRKIADRLYDETKRCKASAVHEKDTVFVKGDLLDEWFTKIHPQITHPYKIIVHNSDKNITDADVAKIDDKIIAMFAQNVMVVHPKLIPLPIGLENAHYANAGRLELFARRFEKAKQPKMFVNFNAGTNPPERNACLEAMKKLATATAPGSALADIVTDRMTQEQYVDLASTYQFVVSPPGNGNDAHRTWEAMYLGCVPIVKKSAGMDYFKSLGLPMVVVEDWNEAGKIEILKHVGNSGHEALHFDYWVNLIRSK